jgi:Pyridoxamine 5'-phosphate oxidase
MLTWGELRDERPDLAETGRALLYQVGVGLGFLATVRADGGPRVHPVCPILTDDGLYLFVVASPKRADLRRDPRYALHAFPTDTNEDAFYVTGVAEPRPDPAVRARLAEQYLAVERDMKAEPPGFADEQLFELRIATCLATKTTGHGDWNPQHTVWKSSA